MMVVDTLANCHTFDVGPVQRPPLTARAWLLPYARTLWSVLSILMGRSMCFSCTR